MSGFDFFVNVCGHIARGHIPPLISCFFFSIPTPNIGEVVLGICPITIIEVTNHLIACTLTIQFRDTIVEHFNPH